jgi:hypothetical protein
MWEDVLFVGIGGGIGSFDGDESMGSIYTLHFRKYCIGPHVRMGWDEAGASAVKKEMPDS